MRVLLLCDDYYHHGDVPIRGVEPLKEKGIAFDVIQDANDFDPGKLKDYACVIMSKSDQISRQDESSWKTDAVQEAFIKYVENGGGLIVTHNGTVIGEHTGKLDQLVGCRFLYHPNQVPVTVQPIKPHPVTEGVGMFAEIDEPYQIEIIASDADVLAAAYAPPQGEEGKYEADPYYNNPGSINAAVYVRTQGTGRVCVLTPGHNLENWLNPHFQRMLVNTLKWCGGRA